MLIARLVAQLHCYIPERADQSWARLRQLGARRERLVTEAVACVQQLRDLLECAWPGVLGAAADPFGSMNWCAALAVVLDRCGGAPERLSRWGMARFEAAVVRELPRWGGSRRRRAIIVAAWRAVWGALPHNPVMATRYRYLTTREHNRLTDGQARAALAAALLRWLHVITTKNVPFDARLAGAAEVMPVAA
ncbi:hypothetical protein [Mycolicibacterium sp. yt]|uniref:hypothetical protein n=1 Tax=Mycolicibacterium sp. yt TaxID=2973093 RepID=UPI00351D45C9